jgi:hypothetical protein
MNKEMLELYSDYLISSFSYTTATGLSKLLDNKISHDKITRFLSEKEYTSKDLWKLVKSTVRRIESEDGIISVDDTIQEKQYTDENEIISWHYDHSKSRSLKGVNIVSCIYTNKVANIPVAFEIVKKDTFITDQKTGKEKRKSSKTKNELMREMLQVCVKNKLKFKYVTSDIWFSSKENMVFVKKTLGKDFVFAIKGNRLMALSKEDKLQGKFQAISSLDPQEGTSVKIFLKGLDFPVFLVKQVFKNKDGSSGILYLVSSDIMLDCPEITTIYKKRWKVEEYHKSIKSNTCLAKSPTRTVKTQNNHFFMSIYAYFKLELLSIESRCNHFALRTKLYVRALKSCFYELQTIKAEYLTVLA